MIYDMFVIGDHTNIYIYIYIYDTCGYWAGRPIHKDMAVAPPWVKLTIVKTNI